MDVAGDVLLDLTDGVLPNCAVAQQLGLCNDDVARAMSNGTTLSPFCPTTCGLSGCEVTVDVALTVELSFANELSPEDIDMAKVAILEEIVSETGAESEWVTVDMDIVGTASRRLLNVVYVVTITISFPASTSDEVLDTVLNELIDQSTAVNNINELVDLNGGVAPEVASAPNVEISSSDGNISEDITLSFSPTAYPTAYPTTAATESHTSAPTAPPTTPNSATKTSIVFGLLVSFFCVAVVV
jgi:hypothetical protein